MDAIKIPLPEIVTTPMMERVREKMDEQMTVLEIARALKMPPDLVMENMSRIQTNEYVERRNEMETKNAWTTREVETAIEMYQKGRKCREIAQEVGRSEGAVAVKLSTLRKEGKIKQSAGDPVAEQNQPQAEHSQPEPEQTPEEPKRRRAIPESVRRACEIYIKSCEGSVAQLRQAMKRAEDEKEEVTSWLESAAV